MSRAAFWQHLLGVLLVAGVLVGSAPAQQPTAAYVLEVDGLACPFCAYGIEKQLGALQGVESVETDIALGTVTVTMRRGARLDEETARKAVEAAGFTMRGFAPQGTGE